MLYILARVIGHENSIIIGRQSDVLTSPGIIFFEGRNRTKKNNNYTNERHAFSALSGCLNVKLTNDRGYDRVTTSNLCYLAKRRGVETRCECFGFVFSHSFIYRGKPCKMKGEGKKMDQYKQVGC